ncbi:MAG: anion permease, partial [Erysipelotrichaceae bacterium]|nr:anion permease [Erysipelotrichaceae bacterium]
PKYKSYVALIAAGIFVVTGILNPIEMLSAIDWNVLLMLSGMMGMVTLFIRSKAPAWLADTLAKKVGNAKWIFILLCIFAGVVSAFIDNVATVLMVAPIGLAIAKKLNVSPVDVVLAIAVSSNLQGAATLVGDTTSILLGGALNMDFMDFFLYKGRVGMFFVVQAGMVMTIPVLLYLFRKSNQHIEVTEVTQVKDWVPSILLVGTVVSLIMASFLPVKPDIMNGLICMTFCVVGIIWTCMKEGNSDSLKSCIKDLDLQTLMLLTGLFVVIAGIVKVGIIKDISEIIAGLGGGNLFLTYTIIVWVSVLLSAFIDNIPYVAAMLPVVGGIGVALGVDVTVLYFGLLAGATLGGNLTPIGASANIAATGILQKEGYEVSNQQFMRIGIPFTLAAVLTGYILIWVLYL